MIAKLEKEGVKSIEATHEAELEWKKGIEDVAQYLLMSKTSSWWNGGNVPGKKAESML